MQSLDQFSNEKRYTRNAYIIVISLMIAIVPSAALFLFFGSENNLPQLFIPAVSLLVTLFVDILLLTLIARGRRNLAMMLVMTAFIINVMIVPFLVQGLGVIIAFSVGLVVIAVVGLSMPPAYSTSGVVVAITFGSLAVLLDALLGGTRVQVPELEKYTPFIVGVIAAPILFVFSREFNRYSLQAKITLGILLTGGITVATLVVFNLNRISFISNLLAGKFESKVTSQTEEEIQSLVNLEAGTIDALFKETQNDLITMAQYRTTLEKEKALLSAGTYWNASEKLTQLAGGQYGNAATDLSSVFIPNTYTLSNAMRDDINTSAYLDFYAPGFLDSHPEIIAIYYISRLGYTTYYPNISLAENIPPDYDPTKAPFYTIVEPANNPEKLPRWTLPYQDPAGAGLIVTVSAPVYDGIYFAGVLSADIQLAQVTKAVSGIKLGETGIPLLLDSKGLIIAMPDSGYQFFGLEPEPVPVNENPRQSILDARSRDAQSVAQQIINTATGLSRMSIGNVDTYLSVSALGTTGYKLVLIVPASELNQEITSFRTEIDQEVSQTVQNMTLILTALFVGAFIASLIVGRVITSPLKRLTETVEQIAEGNLSSRASVESGDESGILARAFNVMADRLTDSLQGLEDRIAQRTRELEILSQSSTRRASLFESIARISRTINSTRSLDKLLPQITETISNQLGYYHVGIFMVDVHRQYAILVAANSEGGRVMLARGHRLRIGETGIVGYVTQAGIPRVALDVGKDAVYFNNPDLPETHSEVALPLRSGSEIIGALDVQSRSTNAFSSEVVNILSVLADQVSVAIQNARSFQQSLDALEQSERAAAQLSEQQWNQFRRGQTTGRYHFDGVTVQELKQDPRAQPNSISIPILLRGTQIGTLKLSTLEPDRIWDDHEIAMAQATAERTALAIETARLLQDAQKRASKERVIGQISARIGSLVNIENIVQTTIEELGATLAGTDVVVQFTPEYSGPG